MRKPKRKFDYGLRTRDYFLCGFASRFLASLNAKRKSFISGAERFSIFMIPIANFRPSVEFRLLKNSCANVVWQKSWTSLRSIKSFFFSCPIPTRSNAYFAATVFRGSNNRFCCFHDRGSFSMALRARINSLLGRLERTAATPRARARARTREDWGDGFMLFK